MKTPEEIKRTLNLRKNERCNRGCDNACPYINEDGCMKKLYEDTLEYIRKLEADKERDRELINFQNDQIAEIYTQNQNKWISVEERMPEPDAGVFAYTDIMGVIPAYGYKVVKYKGAVTHWMPMPEPPEEEEKE